MFSNDLKVILKSIWLTIAFAIVVSVAIAVISAPSKRPTSAIKNDATADLPSVNFYTVPTDSQFDRFVYEGSRGHQCIDLRAYFMQLPEITGKNVEITTRIDADAGNDLRGLSVSKSSDRIAKEVCSIWQYREASDLHEPIADVELSNADGYKWLAAAPAEIDGFLVEDENLGLTLTEGRLNAIIAWATSDEAFGEDRCPFAGFDVPHVAIGAGRQDGFATVNHYD